MIPLTFTFLGGVGVQELILIFIFFVPSIFWLWALIDCATGDFTNSNDKLVWIIVIVAVPFIGWILYFAIGRKKKVRKI
jgi:hypothetical protein